MAQEQNNIETKSMLPVGTLLQNGKYRIERYLSSGGFGNTYVATNTEFDEQVALKEFFMRGISEREGDSITVSVSNHNNVEQFGQQKDKFRKEARRLRKLRNDHLIAVHDLFEENGTAYYEMDLVDGESLGERLKRLGRPLREAEVTDILRQVLDALGVVHAQGLYHLDLKPANIMIDKSGRALLIDFGASKQMYNADGLSVSTSSALAFTLGYAPLEQTEQNTKSFGPWTDLYALGATLYKLLTNETPPSASELLMARDPLSFPADVSQRMRDLIAWMMKPRMDERPQSVDEVKRFLDAANPIAAESIAAKPLADEEAQVAKSKLQPKAEETEVITPKPQTMPKDEETESVIKTTEVTEEPLYSSQPAKSTNKKAIISIVVAGCIIIGFFLISGVVNISKSNSQRGTVEEQAECEARLRACGKFEEGMATYKDTNGKKGFIDKIGKVVIPCQWEDAWSFSESLARVKDANGKWGFIDKTGKVVIPCQWENAGYFSEGLAWVVGANYKVGYIDKTGKVVIPCQWVSADSFYEGLAWVRDANDNLGFIDKTGKVISPCQWKSAGSFREGLAVVVDANGKRGFIDKTGKLVISCQWNYAGEFHEGLAWVWDGNDNWHKIDKMGKIVE